jgi:predicted nucleotide-binding protein
MADIGVQPTKTTIRLTSSTGESGTITSASASQAGVMSAAQAAQLQQLVAKLESGTLSNVTLLPPARAMHATPADVVTRPELQAAFEAWRQEVLADVNDILRRIRTEVPVAHQVSGIDNTRLERAEAAIVGLAQEVDGIKRTLGQLGEISEMFARGAAA